jgi:hypothetical protein
VRPARRLQIDSCHLTSSYSFTINSNLDFQLNFQESRPNLRVRAKKARACGMTLQTEFESLRGCNGAKQPMAPGQPNVEKKGIGRAHRRQACDVPQPLIAKEHSPQPRIGQRFVIRVAQCDPKRRSYLWRMGGSSHIAGRIRLLFRPERWTIMCVSA